MVRPCDIGLALSSSAARDGDHSCGGVGSSAGEPAGGVGDLRPFRMLRAREKGDLI